MRINLKGFNQVTLEMMDEHLQDYIRASSGKIVRMVIRIFFFSLLFGWNDTVIVRSENLGQSTWLVPVFFRSQVGLVVLSIRQVFIFLASVVL
jgi:hypothetical protein